MEENCLSAWIEKLESTLADEYKNCSKEERSQYVLKMIKMLNLGSDDLRRRSGSNKISALDRIPQDILPLPMELADGIKVTLLSVKPIATLFDGHLDPEGNRLFRVHVRNKGEEKPEDFLPDRFRINVSVAPPSSLTTPDISKIEVSSADKSCFTQSQYIPNTSREERTDAMENKLDKSNILGNSLHSNSKGNQHISKIKPIVVLNLPHDTPSAPETPTPKRNGNVGDKEESISNARDIVSVNLPQGTQIAPGITEYKLPPGNENCFSQFSRLEVKAMQSESGPGTIRTELESDRRIIIMDLLPDNGICSPGTKRYKLPPGNENYLFQCQSGATKVREDQGNGESETNHNLGDNKKISNSKPIVILKFPDVATFKLPTANETQSLPSKSKDRIEDKFKPNSVLDNSEESGTDVQQSIPKTSHENKDLTDIRDDPIVPSTSTHLKECIKVDESLLTVEHHSEEETKGALISDDDLLLTSLQISKDDDRPVSISSDSQESLIMEGMSIPMSNNTNDLSRVKIRDNHPHLSIDETHNPQNYLTDLSTQSTYSSEEKQIGNKSLLSESEDSSSADAEQLSYVLSGAKHSTKSISRPNREKPVPTMEGLSPVRENATFSSENSGSVISSDCVEDSPHHSTINLSSSTTSIESIIAETERIAAENSYMVIDGSVNESKRLSPFRSERGEQIDRDSASDNFDFSSKIQIIGLMETEACAKPKISIDEGLEFSDEACSSSGAQTLIDLSFYCKSPIRRSHNTCGSENEGSGTDGGSSDTDEDDTSSINPSGQEQTSGRSERIRIPTKRCQCYQNGSQHKLLFENKKSSSRKKRVAGARPRKNTSRTGTKKKIRNPKASERMTKQGDH